MTTGLSTEGDGMGLGDHLDQLLDNWLEGSRGGREREPSRIRRSGKKRKPEDKQKIRPETLTKTTK